MRDGERKAGTYGGSVAGGAGNGQATAEGLDAIGETAQTAAAFWMHSADAVVRDGDLGPLTVAS